MRRRTVPTRAASVLAALAGVVGALAFPAAAAAAQDGATRVIVALPEHEARAMLARTPSVVGLGVYPGSLETTTFLSEVASGAPPVARDPSLAGRRGPVTLDALIGARLRAAVVPSMRRHPAAALVDALRVEPERLGALTKRRLGDAVLVLVLARAEDAEVALRLIEPSWPARAEMLVLGVGERLPMLLGWTRPFAEGVPRGIIDGGSPRRPGLAWPSDVAASVLWSVGVEPATGASLGARAHPAPLAFLDDAAARLADGSADEQPLARTAFAIAFASLAGAALGIALGERRLAGAFARGAAMVPAGYLGSLFIEHDRWEVRAVAIAGAAVLGATFVIRDTARFCGWVFLGTGAALCALAVAAAAAPDGSIASVLWGSPLTSWRVSGLHARFAAIVAGSLIAGPGLARFPAPVTLLVAGGGAAVLAAPSVGASPTGVFALAAGATAGALVSAAGRVRLWHAPVGAAAGAAALVASLAADRGAAMGHAGAAFGALRARGMEAALDLAGARARLSMDLLAGIGVTGAIAFALLALGLAAMMVWSARATWDGPARGAVAGSAFAALGLLAVSDVGLYAGGIAGSFAAVAAAAASVIPPRIDPPPAAARVPAWSGGGGGSEPRATSPPPSR